MMWKDSPDVSPPASGNSKGQPPRVSVITPVYNSALYLEETVRSVLGQTWTDFELLLVDDGSSDDSPEIIGTLAREDGRIRALALPENRGAAEARNLGIRQARGRYLAFVDSDDVWYPDKLDRQLRFMEETGCGLSYTGYRMVDRQGRPTGRVVRVPGTMGYRDLLKNTVIGCLTVMVDRARTGDFEMPSVRAGQDTATWLMLLRRGVAARGLDEPLADYRQVPGSVSSNKWKSLKRTWHTYRRLEGLALPAALYYISHYGFNAMRRRF